MERRSELNVGYFMNRDAGSNEQAYLWGVVNCAVNGWLS